MLIKFLGGAVGTKFEESTIKIKQKNINQIIHLLAGKVVKFIVSLLVLPIQLVDTTVKL